MTLDEARSILGVARGASHADIRDAFRHRARQVHPDSHPSASAPQREELARHFDRAREARDILLLLPERTFVPEPATVPGPASAGSPVPPASPSPAAPPPPQPWRPSPESSRPLHQRTLRFEEFVQVVDAAGFGPGHRSESSRGLGRVVLWSTVGAVSAGVLISVVWSAIAM